MCRLYFLVAFSPISAASPFENGARAKCSAIANWISVTTPSVPLPPLVPLHPCGTSFHPFHGPHRAPCIQWLRCGAPTSLARLRICCSWTRFVAAPLAFSRWLRDSLLKLRKKYRNVKLNRGRIGKNWEFLGIFQIYYRTMFIIQPLVLCVQKLRKYRLIRKIYFCECADNFM